MRCPFRSVWPRVVYLVGTVKGYVYACVSTGSEKGYVFLPARGVYVCVCVWGGVLSCFSRLEDGCVGGGSVELFQPAGGRVCVWGGGSVELFQPAGGRVCVGGGGSVELFQPARGRQLRVATEPISTRAPYSAQQRRRRPAKQRLLPSSVHHCSQPEPDTLRDPLPPSIRTRPRRRNWTSK